jgi:hypothetical protein
MEGFAPIIRARNAENQLRFHGTAGVAQGEGRFSTGGGDFSPFFLDFQRKGDEWEQTEF